MPNLPNFSFTLNYNYVWLIKVYNPDVGIFQILSKVGLCILLAHQENIGEKLKLVGKSDF